MSEPQREVPDAPELRLERDGSGVATLTLNRPRWKNAIPIHLWQPLRDAFHEVTHDPDDRVLVVTGAGGHFCAGAHLTASAPGSGKEGPHGLAAMRTVNEAALALHDRLRGDDRYLTIMRPELDILVWAPAAPTASAISARSARLFQEAAERHLHLALVELPATLLRSHWPRVEFDRDTVTCLRSCLMKPEHGEWTDAMWSIIDGLADEA